MKVTKAYPGHSQSSLSRHHPQHQPEQKKKYEIAGTEFVVDAKY